MFRCKYFTACFPGITEYRKYSCLELIHIGRHMKSMLSAAVSFCCLIATANALVMANSSADTDICAFSSTARFIESAPRDRFSIQNTSTEGWLIHTIQLDLDGTEGKLIFDVTAQGAGVEVFQPFRDENDGEANLVSTPEVLDGDTKIKLEFENFTSGQQYQFSIDVDDQLTQSELGQIRVSGSEMMGATMTLDISGPDGAEHLVTGAFDDSNRVTLLASTCQ